MKRKSVWMKRALAMTLTGMLCVSGIVPGTMLNASAAEGTENPFADVPESKWYYSYITYALETGLMGGKDETEDGKIIFEPESAITRDQIVQILYNREGRPSVEYVDKFRDIPDGKWYTDAVMWAVEEGITAGKDGGTRFGLNEPITREEMATMLYQYANYKNWDTTDRADFTSFDDADKVSTWAVDYMKWVVAKGIMAGKNNQLAPRESASRAEAATMFKAFLEAYETETPVEEEYTLVWEDNFEGTALNRNDWNVELHEPGWVNNELQRYVDSTENIYVEDGNLVIQAVKTDNGDGTASYTSGRVNTQNKHDFKYGKFEARLKVPSGKGFLPAFWMMPTDESFYGQWPKCGEIDIMEVLGSETATSHGTLHFGEPHTQSQGGYTLEEGDFSSEFHVFSCEWEPGEIRFYVDGELFHTENDWFTKKEGFGEVAYPAPYDQPFYMILNLAVGGDWPGNPDETTEFGDNAQLVVDYVKVYQKDSYDENVEKPDITLEFRDPDNTGNYVINGDFAAEELNDTTDWYYLQAEGGEGSAAISENEVVITSTAAGTQNHSVQFVQPEIPLRQGKQYRLSFDAYADEARTMIANVTAPDYYYVRYLADQSVELTTTKQSYSYDFDMTVRNDINGRIEFCLGNQGSTATVHISNVRLEVIGEVEIPEEVKSILPDGNYVYNGEFQEGMGRLDYWTITNNCEDATVEVTNIDGVRELKVTAPDSVTGFDEITVKQTDVAITGGKTFVLSFDAYADAEKTIKSQVAGQTFETTLTTTKTNYKYTFDTAADLNGSELTFLLGNAGATYIDNVRIQEDGMFINGDFSNGMVGYETYNGGSSSVDFYVDSLNEENALYAEINNTGEADWNIQLKQNNITLENGKWYTISFDAKVFAAGDDDFTRKIMYALQRDGSADDVWTAYSGTQRISLNGEYQNFTTTFQMNNETDTATMLSISMGAVDGIQITTPHTVAIDNITLEEVEEPEVEEIPVGTDLITNGDFADGKTGWEASAINNTEATATEDFTQGKAVYTITNPGTADYHVQLKQSGLTLENGATYEVSFKIKSDAARTITYALLNPMANYDYYGGDDVELAAGVEQTVTQTIVVEKDTINTIDFVISMGKIADVETPGSVIEIDDISIVKLDPNAGGEDEKPATGTELLKNADFANSSSSWGTNVDTNNNAAAEIDFAEGKVTYTITNPGTNNWDVQLSQRELTLENGASYQLQFTMKADVARSVVYSLQDYDNEYTTYKDGTVVLAAGEAQDVMVNFTVDKATSSSIQLAISMGKVDESTPLASIIEISNLSLLKLANTDDGKDDTEEVAINLITNGDFANGDANWTESYMGEGTDAVATSGFADGKATIVIENAGAANWNIQLKQAIAALEEGASYQVNFKIKSTEARTVSFAMTDAPGAWYGNGSVSLTANPEEMQEVTANITGTGNEAYFVIFMGKIDDPTAASTIEIDDISLVKQ